MFAFPYLLSICSHSYSCCLDCRCHLAIFALCCYLVILHGCCRHLYAGGTLHVSLLLVVSRCFSPLRSVYAFVWLTCVSPDRERERGLWPSCQLPAELCGVACILEHNRSSPKNAKPGKEHALPQNPGGVQLPIDGVCASSALWLSTAC